MTADASSIDTVAKLGSQDNVGVDGSTADSSPNASTKAAACSTPTPTTTANKSSSTDATKSINRNTSTTPAQNNNPLPSVVEFEPPLACVRRILKNTLPSSTNVGKDASAAFSRACGIFIIYLTACANDFARENKRQTITANDVLAAVAELDFDEFAPEMLAFLEAYRSAEKTKKTAKAAAAATKQGSLSGTPNSGKTPSGTDANGKTTDDLSDDEDEDDVYDNSTNGGVDTSITGFIEESSSNKRSRPEEDETDSEGGDDEVHGKTASKRTKDLDHELVNENE